MPRAVPLARTRPAPWAGGWLVLLLALLLSACASTPLRPRGPDSFTIANVDGTPLDAAARRWQAGAAEGHSTLHLLPQGLESLAARLALIDAAERGLDLQYYIFRPDGSGAAIAAALWHAAERGVRVRLLLDDWGSRPPDADLQRLARHPRIEVRLFNPLPTRDWQVLGLMLDFSRKHRRMHNKLLVADDRFAITGGRNIGDEYFQQRPELAFGDLDVLAAGPVVQDFSAGFDTYWNSAHAFPVAPAAAAGTPPPQEPLQALRAASTATGWPQRFRDGTLPLRQAVAAALQDDPDKVAEAPEDATEPVHLGARMAAIGVHVQRDLLIVSPYFVPGATGVAHLAALRAAGVRVRIVTNSLAATDVPAVHAGYVRYRQALLERGIELYEVRPDARAWRSAGSGPGSGSRPGRQSLHAKLLVVDGRVTFIGSMNIDPRSLWHNTENGIVVDDAAVGQGLVAGIERALPGSAWRLDLQDGQVRWTAGDGGQPVDAGVEPGASLWLRLQTRLWSLLPLERLL